MMKEDTNNAILRALDRILKSDSTDAAVNNAVEIQRVRLWLNGYMGEEPKILWSENGFDSTLNVSAISTNSMMFDLESIDNYDSDTRRQTTVGTISFCGDHVSMTGKTTYELYASPYSRSVEIFDRKIGNVSDLEGLISDFINPDHL